MANVFSGNPYDAQLASMGAVPPKKAQDPRARIEGFATQYGVPANVLMALDEASGGQGEQTEAYARAIAAGVSTGKSVDAIITEAAGDPARAASLMNRAYDIADELYPQPAPVAPDRPKEANMLRDMPAAIGASIASAAGGVVRGLGEGLSIATDAINDNVLDPFTEGFTGQKPVEAGTKSENILKAPAELLSGKDGLSGFLDSFVSSEVKQDMADLTDPNADLFSPKTWKMGARPTVRGAIYSAVDVFGSMAPVVIVGAVTRSPAAAAAAGASMSAGDAAQTADQVIDAMAANKLPDGRSQLEAESSVYQRLIGEGRTPEQALQITKRRAEQQSAMFAAIPGALGGAATQKILSGAEGLVSRLPWAGRVAGTAALSGLEEGTQEVAEGVAGSAGINSGAGVDQSLTAGSLNDFALGAIGGAPMGAIGGAFSQQQNTAGDGSAGGQEAAPAMGLPGSDAGAASANMPTEPRAPTGPIGRAAALAPDLTPQPEAPPPQSFFPDQKPGSAIKLYDPEADFTHNAVFLGEGPDGVSVRVNGEEIVLNPQEFDQARNEAMRLEEEAKAAAKGTGKAKKKTAAKPVEVPAFPPEDDLSVGQVDDAAPQALQEAGYYEGPWSEEALAAAAPPAPQVEAAGKPDVAPNVSTPSTQPVAADGGSDAGSGEVTQPSAGQGLDRGDISASGNPGVQGSNADIPAAGTTSEQPAALTAARAPVAPMEADPGKRIQPDLLGGQPVTESDMAKKERTSREWGKFLGIAEHGKSSEDMELDGRTAILRPGKIIIRANATGKSDQDRSIDTAGMDRDEISTATRGALRELDRLVPLPTVAEAGSRKARPDEVTEDMRLASKKALFAFYKERAQANDPDAAPAAVLRAVERANNRQESMNLWVNDNGVAAIIPATSASPLKGNPRLVTTIYPDVGPVPIPVTPATGSVALKSAAEAKPEGKPKAKEPAAPFRTPSQNFRENYARNGMKDMASNPDLADLVEYGDWLGSLTDAQWKMLDDAKGFTSAMNPFLNRISLDIEAEKAGIEAIIKPAATPAKQSVAKPSAKAARAALDAQIGAYFTPGNIVPSYGGRHDRVMTFERDKDGGHSVTVESVVKDGDDWVKNPSDTRVRTHSTMPTERELRAGPTYSAAAPAAKPAGLKGLTEAENAKLAALQARFKDKLKNQINSGLDPEMVAIAVEMGALYVKSGIRRFRALVESMMNDMGLTLEQAQPYARNAYNHLRGDMDLNGEDIADMDTDAEVIAEVRKMRAAEAKAPKVATPSPEPAKGVSIGATKEGNASNDSGAAIYQSGSSELEGPSPEPVSDVSAGEPTGTRSAEGEQGRIRPSGEADGQGDAATRSGGDGAAGNGKPAAKRGVKAKRAKKAAVNPDESGPITADAPKVQAAKVNVPAVNFTITDDVRLGQGGIAEKFSDNLAAIRTLKQIQRENRRASPAEQAVLARYVGWGGMKNAFRVAGSKGTEGIAKGWEKRAAELEEMLEPAEYAAARNSTKAAHYTSQSVVKAIWEGARRLGFRGGAVLEPSVGSGNFLGLMPQDLRGPSRVTAVEYDAITAGIAKLLYPGANVLHSGFEKLPIPKGSQSLAIGNPPFGKDQLFFRHNPDVNRKTIHNQFFLASMDSLAPGGILAMVVSHYLMDSLDSTNRLAMAERAELLHAIRLPSNAFEENANTEVVTDILFFRKHDASDDVSALNASMYHGREAADVRALMGKKEATKEQIDRTIELMAKNDRWVGAETINDPAGSGETINVNSYFLRNKGKMIGKLDASGTMNGRAGLNVTMDNPKDFAQKLNEAIEGMQEVQPVDGIVERTQAGYAAMSESLALAARNAEPGEVRVDENGALKMVIDAETLGDSKSMMLELDLTEDTPWHPDYSYRADRKWQITEDVKDENGKPVKQKKADGTLSTRNQKRITVLESSAAIPAKRKWGAKRIEVLKALMPIKQLMKRQFVLESQDGTDQQIERNREKLNAAYDAFVKTHGKLNAKATAEIAFQMPDGALALGAEVVGKDGSISKSAIMSERITRPFVMAERADTPADALAVSLSERGAIDIDRVAGLLGVDVEKAADLLSGGEKPLAFLDPETESWETADAYLSGPVKRKLYAARQAGLSKNVAALEAVQPKQWDSTQISPNIGSTWIPPSIYRDFLKHLGYSSASMSFMSVTNTFSGDVDGDAKPVWQTTGRAFSPSEIVMRLLNSLPMKVTYTDSEKRTHVDEQASVESQQKATEISSEFLDWVYQDANRREALVETFNERYNTRVIRQRDGSHLKMPTKGPRITLRRHQINAIWRGITDKAVLYDHAVGAGKTFTAIARIMERRRMGLSRKPMVVVPNHLIEQWAADFKVLYPGANVLAAGKADFETNNRRRLFAKIASGDYDAVIIGHSSFNFIDIDPSTEMRFLEEELRAANEAIKEAEEAAAEEGFDQGWRKPMGVAEAERLVTKIQTRLDRLREGKRDRLLTFEEMGIDDLTVDESHEFKNLAYSSRLQNVSGMGNKNGSAKATNLHLKARSLHEREGTSMAFLSGTPISNSVSEMYLILRNLVPNELREMGLENFDAWRSAFVSVATQWEPTESGGLKEVARLGREWTNMRALMDLYYSVSDAVPIEDVIKNYPLDNDGKRFPIPPVKSKVEGKGDREMVAVKPDEAQRAELRAIVSGFESLPGMEVKERNAERLRLMDRARKVSLDARAVNPNAKVADGTGKIGATVENVMRLYEKWNEDKGTQVIFLDRSVPKAQGAEKFVAEYDDLLDKLRVAEADEKEKDIEKLVEKLAKYDPNEVEAQRVAIAGGWNAYSEIRRQLVAKGIHAEEIAFVQDANSDAEKKELFERVNSGEVRVILGSTPRMGAGTNIQKRLVGLHHVDVTWKPSDIEQREGRIVRFGNELLDKYGFDLFQAEVIAYATEMTVDAKMWALNATKLKAINGIRKYDGSFNMEFEDEESANMAEMAALATGNPLMVERVMLDGELKKLDMSRRTFNNRMNGMRAELDRANKTIDNADGQVAVAKGFADDVRTARKAAMERSAQRKIDISGTILKDSDSARAALAEEISRQRAGDENARWSVQIDGNKVTTADTANAEITRIFGTPGFDAAVNGKTEVSFSRASAAIADHINRTVAAASFDDSVAIDGITILGMPVEVDSYINPYARTGSTDRVVSFSFLHNKKEAWSTEQDASKGTITQQGVRAALDKIFERMTPEQQEGNAAYYAEEKVKAIEKKPELEAELGKPWPLAEDYEKKKARQAEVIASLEKASVNDQLDEDEASDKEARIAPVPVSALRDVSAALAAEIKASGLQGKVSPALVRNLLGKSGVPIQGRQSGAKIEIAADSADPVGVMRHEIVHALRDEALWSAPYGLFTGAEWKALVSAARANADLMARVGEAYSDLPPAAQIEEAVAEMYREWAGARDAAGPMARIFNKVAAFFRAFASALRGEGFADAAMVMERIAAGTVGGRGPDGDGRRESSEPSVSDKEMRGGLIKAQDKFKGLVGSSHWKNPGDFVSNKVTDAMVGGNGYNALALVPGRALFAELGKYLPSARAYLRQKEEMDSIRNDWHARADKVAQRWLEARGKNPAANEKLADLMHKSTLSGIDPSRPDTWQHAMDAAARREVSEHGDEARDWAKATMSQIAAHEGTYAKLKVEYDALPLEFRQLYRTVRNGYDAMGEAFEKAILQNIQNATKVGLKRAVRAHEKEIARIRDEGLEGVEREEAIASADATLKAIKMRGGFAAKARLAAMRKKFESNRLKGPYFPLARFGDYFVTVRDATGAVTSFSKFEKESQQQAFIREMKAQGETKIEFGTMDDAQKLRGQIDPGFVADIENMLAESGASDEVMDAVWQRWLESLPDRSIRTSNIHRKGRTGYSADAFRAFSKQMFHGGHQLSKLEHGLLMEEHLNDAEEQARKADNPNRALQVVAEMKKRHDFTMNPKGNRFVAAMSNLAFVWYLGATPAAAIANMSQTTVVGIPLMAARFGKAGVIGSSKALGAATKDFVAGRGKVSKRIAGVPVWSEQWTAENSPNLSSDERAAVAEAVRRGTIDKTQAHDLASAAEHGIEYNATREKWMRKIGFFFHHAERFNREVTFLASYRLAKAEGLDPAAAVDAAADLTFKIHFDMQNNSRPRFMQNDIGKVLTTFRQFTVNMLWRLFRDTHQALNGATKEDRREARVQLTGLTLSMMAHAGIRGVWGYGLLMMLLGMLAPGADDDDIKEWLQEALLMQGDSAGVAAWNFTMGAALNGVPGQVLGVDLTDRIGMPNLWFREAPNDLEGTDLYTHYVMEIMGPAVGVGGGFARGAQLAADGEWWRGTEAAVPKVIRDGMKSVRYVGEGVQTLKGDSLIESLSPYQALVQSIGFTPAEIAERYEINSRLKDREAQVTDERSGIQKAAAKAILEGEGIPADILAQIGDFNSRYPEYPITGDSIKMSARSKVRASDRSEFGIILNPKLNDRLRGERATPIGR